MTDKTTIKFAGHPDLTLKVRMKPLDFEVASEGAFALAIGDVRMHFDEIPLHLSVPFLRRRVLTGSVGPFGVHIKPFEAKISALGLETRGVFGRDGAEFDLHGTGACKAEVEVSGKLPEQFVKESVTVVVEE